MRCVPASDDQEDLTAYAGRRVELRGAIDDEFEPGEIELEEEDGFVEIITRIRQSKNSMDGNRADGRA